MGLAAQNLSQSEIDFSENWTSDLLHHNCHGLDVHLHQQLVKLMLVVEFAVISIKKRLYNTVHWVCSVKDFCHLLRRRAVAAATIPAANDNKGNIGNLDWIISKKSFAAHLSFRTIVSSLKTILGVSLSNFIISDKTECRQDV